MRTIRDTSGVNPVHVRTLQEIVRCQSFSRAAETLHLSQPAVSHHVRHLEEEVGQPLLERVGKRALPTPAGEVLLGHAARAFAELEAARQSLQELRGRVAGRLSVGTGATASTYLLPPLLRRLHARHPDLELVVVTGNSAEMVAAVAASHLDLAVEVRARELIARPLAPPLGRRLGIVRRRDRAASPALRAFLDGLEALAVRRRGSRRASATPSRA